MADKIRTRDSIRTNVRDKYAKNGRKYVEDNHDVAQICKRLCETYTGIKDN